MSEPSEQSMERSREVVRKEGDRAFSIKGIHPTLGEMWSTSPAKPDWVEQVQTALAALLDAAIEGERERCAKIAGTFHADLDCEGECLGERRVIGEQIAAAIRGEQ
ncbi:MAG: hypothetical protein GY820_39440 [Gammaproteobacteria bacterium]|nr:hypothetical protein [Gammaproteobacteria bacterium]